MFQRETLGNQSGSLRCFGRALMGYSLHSHDTVIKGKESSARAFAYLGRLLMVVALYMINVCINLSRPIVAEDLHPHFDDSQFRYDGHQCMLLTTQFTCAEKLGKTTRSND